MNQKIDTPEQLDKLLRSLPDVTDVQCVAHTYKSGMAEIVGRWRYKDQWLGMNFPPGTVLTEEVMDNMEAIYDQIESEGDDAS